MAQINSQLLFLTTSPRTPEKMIPEIKLLIKHFKGEEWNSETQRKYMEVLRDEDFFNGQGAKDPAFSARDRINRAPKSLGFVKLSPRIELTPAGYCLLNSQRTDEIFLRQLLKFQIPSPFHKPTDKAANFCIKPYLEIIRLIRNLGTLKFDELQIFGMQLTNYRNFDTIVNKIKKFREKKAKNEGNYKVFKKLYLHSELNKIYRDRINSGNIKTRESSDVSKGKFIVTQENNTRDYADACIRYLRATELVNISHYGKSLSIVQDRIDEVDYILQTVDRKPKMFNNESEYMDYLGSINTPTLLTDNKELITRKIRELFPNTTLSPDANTESLKQLFSNLLNRQKTDIITKQIAEIKSFSKYNEIQKTFDDITNNTLYDAPLMMEWNTWRAMTMLDGGSIKANLNFDDYGAPLSTASGNMSDIVCDYGDYLVCVEVTLSSGQRQYETEGEPVTRHMGKLKTASGKPCYCLFIAPKINEACISHFYILHHLNLSLYGGKSTIIPLPLSVFRKMIEESYKADYIPDPSHIRSLFEASNNYANSANNEVEWYEKILNKASHWLE